MKNWRCNAFWSQYWRVCAIRPVTFYNFPYKQNLRHRAQLHATGNNSKLRCKQFLFPYVKSNPTKSKGLLTVILTENVAISQAILHQIKIPPVLSYPCINQPILQWMYCLHWHWKRTTNVITTQNMLQHCLKPGNLPEAMKSLKALITDVHTATRNLPAWIWRSDTAL